MTKYENIVVKRTPKQFITDPDKNISFTVILRNIKSQKKHRLTYSL